MDGKIDKIDQKDINNTAWAACDTFRGVVDPAQYKDYILVMLFLKYISDVWQDHYEAYRKRYGDDDARIRRKLGRERFVLPEVRLTEKDEKTGEETLMLSKTSRRLWVRLPEPTSSTRAMRVDEMPD